MLPPSHNHSTQSRVFGRLSYKPFIVIIILLFHIIYIIIILYCIFETHVSQFFFLGRLHSEFRQSLAGKTVRVRQGPFYARYMRHRHHFGFNVFFLGLRPGLRTGGRTGGRRRLVLPSLVLLVIVLMQRRYIQLLLFVCKGRVFITFYSRLLHQLLCTGVRLVLKFSKFFSTDTTAVLA